MQAPDIAIVILNWNGRKFLEQFLPSVMASLLENVRVVVADNASTDDSVLFLQQNYPAIEILQNTVNEGFARGYNTALKQVQADYYVLLNSDVEVSEGWLQPLVNLMESDESIAVCQPKILAYHQKTMFEYAGASGGWLDAFGYPFMRGRVFDDCETDNGQYNNVQPCFWASGAAFFVRAEVFNAAKGFDEFFFAHQEEIDLCWRLQLEGYKIMVQPASIVYHVGGGTLPKGNSLKVYLNFRNNLVMLAKNLPFFVALRKIPFRLLLDAISAWKGLFHGDRVYFLAIFKAHLHLLRWIILDRSKSVFPVSKKGKLDGCYGGSVVWDYFVRKKKTFSEIIGSK